MLRDLFVCVFELLRCVLVVLMRFYGDFMFVFFVLCLLFVVDVCSVSLCVVLQCCCCCFVFGFVCGCVLCFNGLFVCLIVCVVCLFVLCVSFVCHMICDV